MLLVRLSILLLSTLGWLGYLRKNMRVEFALGVFLTGVGSLMFAAGIFHVMKEAAWLVFFGGLWLMVREIRSHPDRKNGILDFYIKKCEAEQVIKLITAIASGNQQSFFLSSAALQGFVF